MSTAMGPVVISGIGVAAIAGENIIGGKDPVPALFAGSIVMFGTSLLAEWNAELATAFAVVFMLGALLSHPAAYSQLIKNVGTATSATKKGSAHG
jgi:hypothetical protein